MTLFIKAGVFSAMALIGTGTISSLSAPAITNRATNPEVLSIYNSIEFVGDDRPDSVMFRNGIEGLLTLKASNRLSNDKEIITLIDFTKPSSEKRMWVIDLKERKVLYHTLVAHGRNSGELFATEFSNVPNSNQSSLGLYITGHVYTGKNGTSMKLHGMEPGVNDMAEGRAIVMHGANYVSDDFVKKTGRLGRSFGCPAVPLDLHKEIISLLADGTCLFIYHKKVNMS